MKLSVKTVSILFVFLFAVTTVLPVFPLAIGDIEVEESVKEQDTQIVSEIVIDPIEPEPVKPETTENKNTEKVTEKITEKETKPSKVPSTDQNVSEKQQNNGNGNKNNNSNVNANANVNGNKKPQNTTNPVTETKEETLPKGQFYVYLEPNNGEQRLKHVMKGEGLLPEPEEPKREGFDFDGWYSDPDFKTEWSFSSSIAKKGTVIYAKWIAEKSTVLKKIKIIPSENGKIEVNPSKAAEGEIVNITVIPDEGKRLKSGSLKINGKETDFLSFSMPKGNVEIQAEFEDIPDIAQQVKSSSKLIPIIVILAVLVIAVIVFFVLRGRNNTEDEDEEVWFDESITVEDAFKEHENATVNDELTFDDIQNDVYEEGNFEISFEDGDETL